MNSEVKRTISNTGQAKRNMGARKLVNPRPLVNQTTISLSRYILVNVLTMAINSDSVKMVGNLPRVA